MGEEVPQIVFLNIDNILIIILPILRLGDPPPRVGGRVSPHFAEGV